MLPWVLALDLLGLGLAPLWMHSFIFFVCFMYFMYFCQVTPSYGCVYQKLTLVIPPPLYGVAVVCYNYYGVSLVLA